MVLSSIEALFSQTEDMDYAVVEKRLDALVHSMGEERFSQLTAQYLVKLSLPETALPESLKRFSAMVHNGVTFLIAQTPYHRLKKVILNQLQLPPDCETAERLLHLALHYPTLQKLGQVIARNSTIAKDIKRWLIPLEGELQPDGNHDQTRPIRALLKENLPDSEIEISEDILAVASVAEVIRFRQYDGEGRVVLEGVFKILKPEIEQILDQEMEILKKALLFFESNRDTYDLENMKIAALFDTVRVSLAKEIDLLTEQRNLAEAQENYRHNDRILIPRLQSFCSPSITAMEYIAGVKITETDLPLSQRKHLAGLLFEAIICVPLFQHMKKSLFHGDPHAGNILAVVGSTAARPAIALLDWTLAGHLSKNTRISLLGLLVGIVSCDLDKIGTNIEQLADQRDDQPLQELLPQRLNIHMSQPDFQKTHPLKQSFLLLEKLTMDGLLFSAELILFRKAFFTLEGVLEELYPGFAMETAMEEYLHGIVLKEMPLRLNTVFCGAEDNSGDYQSMLSNEDLSKLTIHQSKALWQQMMKNSLTLIETQTKLNNDFFSYFNWFYR